MAKFLGICPLSIYVSCFASVSSTTFFFRISLSALYAVPRFLLIAPLPL